MPANVYDVTQEFQKPDGRLSYLRVRCIECRKEIGDGCKVFKKATAQQYFCVFCVPVERLADAS